MWISPRQLCDEGTYQLCGSNPASYVTRVFSNYVDLALPTMWQGDREHFQLCGNNCQLCGLCSANYVDLPLQLCGPLSPFVQRRVDQNQGNFPIWPMQPCTYPQSLACWQCDSQHAAEESVDHWPMLSSAVYVNLSGMSAGLKNLGTFP